jgi:thiamine transport system ATP-binding protein
MSEVALREVSITFDDVPALEDVSLTVTEGEFFTLVGPSGCGKTTTLRTVAGFETPDSGTVSIGGEDVGGVPPEDRNVGIVFQNYALFPHMSVRENVAYGLRYRDPPGDVSDDERVQNLLELVDMAEMGERDPEELSGGQQQRIALARALAPGPDVLLLDEPLSALDARLRERLRVVIKDLQQELGITTIYVTHDQAEALAVSDRVAVMNGGRVEQIGPPEAIYREPATRFVAEFVGDNNLLEATVVGTDPPQVRLKGQSPDGQSGPTISVDSLPASDTAALHSGDTVTLSIRPEAIRLADESAPVTLSATVDTVEFMGEAYRVHCSWSGQSLLVKSNASEASSGEVTVGFDPADLRLVEES